LEHPGKGARVGRESGDVGLETSESLVTGDATVRYVDEVKARLGLYAAVHVGGDGEEWQICADNIRKGESGEVTHEGLCVVEGLAV